MTTDAPPAGDRWEAAPPLDPNAEPLIEQRIGRDLVLAAHLHRAGDKARYYVLAHDSDGNYLSRIAEVRLRADGGARLDAVWPTAIESARVIYPSYC